MNPTDHHFRPATLNDLEPLTDLKWVMNKAEYGALPAGSPIPPLLALAREAAQAGVLHYFEAVRRQGGAFYVLEVDGQIVGSGGWHRYRAGHATKAEAQNQAMIFGIVVDPKAQGQGLGRIIMNYLEAEVRAAGITTLRLGVTEGNSPARGLYEGLGFAAMETLMLRVLE